MNLKKIIFVFIGFFYLLAGCGSGSDSGNEISKNLDVIEKWIHEQIPESTNTHLDLPQTHPDLGGEIVWESMDENIISNDGTVVLREGIEETLLLYEITFNGQSLTQTLDIEVSAFPPYGIADKFENEFPYIIQNDCEIETEIEGVTVEWESSNTDVFTNEGIYIMPNIDTLIIISYEFEYEGEVYAYQLERKARGISLLDKQNIIDEWLETNYLSDKLINEELELPTYYEDFDADLTWQSSNPDVISTDGKVTQFPFERYISLKCIANVDDINLNYDYSVIVEAKEETTKVEKINGLLDAISVRGVNRLIFSGYANINQSYNFLPFYENVDASVVEQIIPLNIDRPEDVDGSRPGIELYSVEFITIHDTASTSAGATAKMHADLLSRGYSASWHFAIDEDGSYQSIPTDEVAWHAGDGSTKFGLNDTGVKASGPYPLQTISKDGYFELNGEKTSVKAPTDPIGRILTTSHITDSGIYTTIGANGNYYINNTYFSKSYNKISNCGGNRNSIGIESCVNNGGDYHWTVRNLAKLVAELLIANDLDVDRVLQHNNFSGKPCPNSIRSTGYWDTFLDLISMEKFAKEQLADVNFEWESLTDILDNKGMISREIGNTENLEYKVVVSFDDEIIERSFNTKLN